MSAEDDAEDAIVPRLEAAGADLAKIHVIEEVTGNPPVIPGDLRAIEAILKQRNARLLLIDPLTAYLAADTRSDREVRRALHPLKIVCKNARCATTYLRHLNRSSGTRATSSTR